MDVKKVFSLFKQKASAVGVMDNDVDIEVYRRLNHIRICVSCEPQTIFTSMDFTDFEKFYCCYNVNIKSANGTLIASKTKTMNFLDNTIDFELDVNQYVSIVEFTTSGAHDWNGDWRVKFDVFGY